MFEQRRLVNLVGLSMAALGLVLMFGGLAHHFYTVIRPVGPFLAYGAAGIEERRTHKHFYTDGHLLPGMSDIDFLVSRARGFTSQWVPPDLGPAMKEELKEGVEKSVEFYNDMIADRVAEVREREGVDPDDELTVRDVILIQGYWQFGSPPKFADPTFVYLAFTTMRARMNSADLGALAAGFVLLTLSVAVLIVMNRSVEGIWKSTGFAVSIVAMCGMTLVMKLACDSVSEGDAVEGAVVGPLVFIEIFCASALMFLAILPRFAGANKWVNIVSKFVLFVALLAGSLFFPCGVVAAREGKDRFKTGLGLLFSSFVLGVVGVSIALFGRWNEKKVDSSVDEVKPLIPA